MCGYAIIAAGGLGKRMKLRQGESKQYLKLAGKPLLYHTLAAFEKALLIEKIAIATGKEYVGELQRLIKRYGFKKPLFITEGGKERQDSIYNCIELVAADIASLSASAQTRRVILIHDGARPFIQPKEIDRITELAYRFGACVPATLPKDTIKVRAGESDFIAETLDRSRLVQVQTPQGFRARTIIAAHRKAQGKKFYATDDAALVERFFPHQKLRLMEMDYHNFKLTTPEDLDFGRAILKRLQQKKRKR
ncbi:MAG: 2-C-methyl-D-erythritol 4-phosphate cytidylyltransferase [Rhizobacter sp.]|nr:2-C-methyl-D-erythritol 4-phosphate cytidylyltransferase [Chlorobiales bacterium]